MTVNGGCSTCSRRIHDRTDNVSRLDALPEIEREEILAGRLEEMQKYKDSQQLDAMFRGAGMAGEEDDESGDEPSRKRRKHTSVTKATSRALGDLKKQRKAKTERSERRVSS